MYKAIQLTNPSYKDEIIEGKAATQIQKLFRGYAAREKVKIVMKLSILLNNQEYIAAIGDAKVAAKQKRLREIIDGGLLNVTYSDLQYTLVNEQQKISSKRM